MKRIRRGALAIWGILAAFLIFMGCSREPVRTSHTFLALDTVVDLTIYGEEERGNRRLLEEAEALCRHYESLFSMTIETSDISRFNAAPERVEVDPNTAEVVEIGLRYSRLSGGVFDITIAPVSSLWRFGQETARVPDSGEIAALLDQVNYERVAVEGVELVKTAPVQLDLGGVAKGWIADELGRFLEGQGVESGLINLGGNVLTLGTKPGGSPWTVAVERPFGEGEFLCRIDSADSSVVTSGVYQRYFPQNGILYHHLLDTDTGYPVQNELYAVTVLSKASVEAEVLSTLCFLLGPEEGLALLNDTPGAEGFFVTVDYKIWKTEGLEAAYQIQWEQ